MPGGWVGSSRRAPGPCLFRVGNHAGIWCVMCNGAFVEDFVTKAAAIDAAHAAAAKAQALGHVVQVVTG
jgi:hypothetical protein